MSWMSDHIEYFTPVDEQLRPRIHYFLYLWHLIFSYSVGRALISGKFALLNLGVVAVYIIGGFTLTKYCPDVTTRWKVIGLWSLFSLSMTLCVQL
jgi:hypothetical protein